MDIYQKIRENDDSMVHKSKNEGHQEKLQPPPPPPPSPPPSTAAPPPSASSSPPQEFSFTISLHPSATTERTKSHPSFAIDLSPADDIFFHGHLLPLHLLSHLPVSPPSSTNLIDSFPLPINELSEKQSQNRGTSNILCSHSNDHGTETRIKPRSFSLFGFPKWRKGSEIKQKQHQNQKRKLRFDLSHVLKRYKKLVRPILPFRRRRGDMQFQRESCSFSGNLRGNREGISGRRREYSSAPASMWTSPTNSGQLIATGGVPSCTSDSTMEELQAAIQAAITHCKNSFAMEEKEKSHDLHGFTIG